MKKYWQGVLTGVLTGVAIGYLTAPEAGKKTRKKLGDTLNDETSGLSQKLKSQWDKTVSLAEELITNVKAESGLFADQAQGYLKEASDTYQKANVKDTYKAKVDGLADAAKSGVNKAEDTLKTS